MQREFAVISGSSDKDDMMGEIMHGQHTGQAPNMHQRCKGYDHIMGTVSRLLIALVKTFMDLTQ